MSCGCYLHFRLDLREEELQFIRVRLLLGPSDGQALFLVWLGNLDNIISLDWRNSNPRNYHMEMHLTLRQQLIICEKHHSKPT